jgi:hypothetical protein
MLTTEKIYSLSLCLTFDYSSFFSSSFSSFIKQPFSNVFFSINVCFLSTKKVRALFCRATAAAAAAAAAAWRKLQAPLILLRLRREPQQKLMMCEYCRNSFLEQKFFFLLISRAFF